MQIMDGYKTEHSKFQCRPCVEFAFSISSMTA